jgi:hypothetical protein
MILIEYTLHVLKLQICVEIIVYLINISKFRFWAIPGYTTGPRQYTTSHIFHTMSYHYYQYTPCPSNFVPVHTMPLRLCTSIYHAPLTLYST